MAKQDALRSFSGGGLPMFYVYLIESISTQGQRYVGVTADLKQRLQEQSGKVDPYFEIQAMAADDLCRV